VRVKVLSGPLRGKTVMVENILGDNPAYNIPLREGARVLLSMELLPQGPPNIYITNRDRMPALMFLFGLFMLAVILAGGRLVFRQFILLSFGLILLNQGILPALVNGEHGVVLFYCATLVFALAGLLVMVPEQWQKPRILLAFLAGLLINLSVMLFLLVLAARLAPLQGFSGEEVAALWYEHPHMDFSHLFYLSGLLAYLGVLFYLMWFIFQTHLSASSQTGTSRYLYLLDRGRQVAGPVLGMLGFLYIGLFMSLFLQARHTPSMMHFMNLESTATVVVIFLIGGTTLLLSLPITARLASWFLPMPEAAPPLGADYSI
jgi:uncharacterized membrane protein